MPLAIPQGKSFTIQAEHNGAKIGDPSVIAKVLWKEKRSGEVFQGHLSGPATHSLLLALAGLREKAQEMVRAAKCQSRHQGRATKKSDVVVEGAEGAKREAERESMFMLPGMSFSGFEIPLRERRWSVDRT